MESVKYPNKVRDIDGNIFVFKGVENGIPLYTNGKSTKHIFDLEHYEVMEDK